MADIVQMDKSYIQQYVDNNMLVDLQPYVDSGIIDLSDVDPVVQEFGRIGDGLYAICIGVNSPALLYNKTLLDENDITIKDNMTMDEFLDLCREIYEKTGYKTNLQYNNGTSFMDFFLRSSGETLFKDGQIGASEETIKNYFALYETGLEEGWLIDPSVFAEVSIGQPEQEPLVYGSDPSRMSWCAFYFSNNMTSITNAAPEGMEIGITTWPADDAVKSNYLKPSMFFSVSVDSENPEEAARLINFWINSVECNEILMGERGVPVSSVVASAITPQMDETSQKVVTFINDVVTPNCSDVSPASPNGATEVYDVIYKLEEAICYGEKTAEEAASELLTKGNDILSSKQ
jgi:multiple sugar transport system substrate-binding protein